MKREANGEGKNEDSAIQSGNVSSRHARESGRPDAHAKFEICVGLSSKSDNTRLEFVKTVRQGAEKKMQQASSAGSLIEVSSVSISERH